MDTKKLLQRIEAVYGTVQSRLLKENPKLSFLEYLVNVLYATKIEVIESKDVMSALAFTDGKTIYVIKNKNYPLTDKELLFVLCHEVLHIIQDHVYRGKGKNTKIFNIATDLWINHMLYDNYSYQMKMPEGVLYLEKCKPFDPKNYSEEEIYEKLLKDKEFNLKQKTIDLKNGIKIELCEVTLNGERKQFIEDITISPESLQKIKDFAAQVYAQNEIKYKGNFPGNIEDRIKELIKVKIDWEKVLESVLQNYLKKSDYYSWARINPYYQHSIIRPYYVEEPKHDTVVLTVDTSGSMSNEELGKILYILKKSSDFFEKLVRIEHDTEVTRVEEYESDTIDLNDKFYQISGRGGTSHESVFNLIQEKYSNASLILVCTDGHSDIEEIYKKYDFINKIPTVILTTGRTVLPEILKNIKIEN